MSCRGGIGALENSGEMIGWELALALVALALQETRTDSGILMEPPFGCSLFLGPCVTGTGPSGRPSRSRGCGWLVDTETQLKRDLHLKKSHFSEDGCEYRLLMGNPQHPPPDKSIPKTPKFG